MTDPGIDLADPPAPEPAPDLPPPTRWHLVSTETGEVNPILWDGVTPYTPPDGWRLEHDDPTAAP